MFYKINSIKSEITNISERSFLETIKANCNSPVSVYASIIKNEISIQCQLFDHNGSLLFNEVVSGLKENNLLLAQNLGKEIIDTIGQKKINELDILKDDFNYTPS